MANSVTVTGKDGPNQSVTALVINNVESWRVINATAMLYVKTTDKTQIQEFDISGKSTFTVTVSGGTYAVSVS